MNKYERHSRILQVVREEDIQTQEELAKKLTEHGVFATQATISRDIRELRLMKVLNDQGIYKYATGSIESVGNLESRLSNVFAESVLSVQSARNIVVVKTLSGMAQAAASAIDSMEYSEVLGCIAGDDTIMVVTAEDKGAAKISARLKMMLR